MNKISKEKYFYRFMGIDKDMVSRLIRELHINIKSKWNENLKGYIVIVPLVSDNICSELRNFINKYKVQPDGSGVWVDGNPDDDQFGFSVPRYILDLIKDTDCALDVSIIFID